ncbi:hypothetical protein N8S91_10145 [Enterobacter roggenkampii]|uniref:glycine-rich domain-containing protein n=1 Tax=Enterobacter roggenkampii TaxID=1812935 RepID=UPI0021C65FF8|nr:hypothetical protein [Enterobacter roggenkampii]MCU3050340.1 hypothetical protein [Enterobacter roggenkampii]MCU3446783.1 hypothetical protein [Enterobacter hormaechei subsp. steigerwaltii]
MATNNFKPFATAANANVMSQADWEALPALLSGFISGPAKSAQVNKAIRQASFIAAALAQYTANKSGLDVLDDGDLNGFIAKMSAAFGKDFQALDATLTALAGLTTGANKLPYFTGTDTASQTDLTSVGRDIIGKGTIADILTYLGLGDGSYVGRLIGSPKVFKSSGTYTPTKGTKYAIAEVQGAGGGGGNATGNTTTSVFGTSGGAGAYALSFFAITSGTASIVVGAGGVPAGNGGTSSFSGFNNTIIAAGGDGGTNNLGRGSASSSVHARGADGGNSSGGTLVNAKGAAGTPSFILSGTPSGGTGGDSHFSGGALGAGAQGGAGQNAILGAGGSGATAFMENATYNGGYGGDGIVIIWEYA